MMMTRLKQTLIAVLAATAVEGATTTSCNPLSATCSADTALATAYAEDFTTNSTHFETYHYGDRISYTDDGLKLTLAERYDNPSLVSTEYILFGRVEALVKSANGTGIISTIYLQSDVEDEIDWEWFGGDGTQVATDFFRKGNTTDYDRGTYYSMDGDPRTAFHNYTIDWTEEAITWYVDGSVARTLKNTSSEGFPQTPSRLFIGLWAGGDASNDEGTIEWAGGSTDYSDAPFYMYIKDLVVSDYSTGSSYSYSDTTGDLSSLEAKDGSVYGRYSEGVEEFDELVDGETLSGSSESSTSSAKSSSKSKSKSKSTSKTASDSAGSTLHSSSSVKISSATASASASATGSGSSFESLAAEDKTEDTDSATAASDSGSAAATGTDNSSSSGSASATASTSSSTGGASGLHSQFHPALVGITVVPVVLVALL